MMFLLMLACALMAAGGGPLAQSRQNDQVEVKTDRFSEATTIKLKSQTILDTPDQFITMTLEAKFGDKKIRSEMDQAAEIMGEKAFVRFESQGKGVTDFGDKELRFIIDGKRLKVGESAATLLKLPGRDPELKPGFKSREIFTNGLSLAQMKQVAEGNHVEMRLGKYELVLSPAVLGNLRAFVNEFTKHASSSKLKEKRP
ncbi:MAG: hypothetical protein ACREEM_04465 [Blastocatellia bacterium]